MLSIGYICKNSSNNNSSSTAAEKQTARKNTHKHISIYSTKNDRVRLLKTHGCCSLFPVIVYCTNSVCVSFLLVCALLPKHFWSCDCCCCCWCCYCCFFSCTFVKCTYTVHSSHVDFPIGYVALSFSQWNFSFSLIQFLSLLCLKFRLNVNGIMWDYFHWE